MKPEETKSTLPKVTKKCPYCGEEINADAKKCRYCGEWLAKDADRPSETIKKEPEQSGATAADVMDGVSAGLGCVWALVKLCVPVVLLIFAYNSKQSLSGHKKEVANDVVECTKDEVKADTNIFIPGLGSLASNIIDGSISNDNVKNMFYRYNRLELDDSWFWNKGVLYNSENPDGTTVSFGMFGVVIPFVDWDDFKLMEN